LEMNMYQESDLRGVDRATLPEPTTMSEYLYSLSLIWAIQLTDAEKELLKTSIQWGVRAINTGTVQPSRAEYMRFFVELMPEQFRPTRQQIVNAVETLGDNDSGNG
jgi:hypothetical protein